MSAFQRNNVRIFGTGTHSIIFAHGYGSDQQSWKAILPAFESDYRLIVFDHIGSGGSDTRQYDIDKYSTLDGYTQDLLDICRQLELRDAYFVGHSVGAMIGILAAIQCPQHFKKMVLISPSPCYINDTNYIAGFDSCDVEDLLSVMESDYQGWAYQMAPLLMGNLDRPELGQELKRSFYRNDTEISLQFARVIFNSDYRYILPRLSVPSLIAQCSLDAMAPPTVGVYMHQHLAHSQLLQLQANGHYPHLSAPEEIIEAIRTFMELPDMMPAGTCMSQAVP